jgi:AcrR family transcriptional regulator
VPNQERARVLVAAILEASAHVLEVHGFEGATTARIAQKAGVSVGSLYQYFGTKEALFDALTAELIERLMLAVAPVVAAPDGTVEERIERALDAGFRVIAPYPTVLRQLAAATDTAFEARLSVLRRPGHRPRGHAPLRLHEHARLRRDRGPRARGGQRQRGHRPEPHAWR